MIVELYSKAELDPVLDFLIAEKAELKQMVTEIYALQEEWVKGPAAAKIVGFSTKTLQREKERPGTLIKYNATDKTYERKSLIAYKNQKRKVVKLNPIEIRNALLQKK